MNLIGPVTSRSNFSFKHPGGIIFYSNAAITAIRG